MLRTEAKIEKDTIKDIRESWFKDHQVTDQRQGNPGEPQSFTWTNPHSSSYWMRYIIDGRHLIVIGDTGDAIFEWGQPLTWTFLAGLSPDYFAGKCQASEGGRRMRGWDESLCLYHVRQHFAEVNKWEPKRGRMPAFKKAGGMDAMGSPDRWVEWLRDFGSEFFGQDWWDGVPGWGEVAHPRMLAYLVGIQMARERGLK